MHRSQLCRPRLVTTVLIMVALEKIAPTMGATGALVAPTMVAMTAVATGALVAPTMVAMTAVASTVAA